ncbi:hypothetical protein LR48_Vigan216s000400 [Vigna angularis]|uniref:Uncharacterized protein n=1 Tax=Phaseolus angularis TaxID=3914 RepID=A0A0L9T624_PHAAN|nr:hypothetical protein LR48_Vigan216s000400 [Vigna angularis]
MAEENNGRRTLADYTNVVGPQHFNSIARPMVNAANMEEEIRNRSKKTSEPLPEGLDESIRRRRIRTSRELFPSPEKLLQP